MDQEEKMLSPHKINIFGRKQYSVKTVASDYIDYNLDDLWNSIGKLWVLTVLIGIIAIYEIFYDRLKGDN